MSEFNGKSYNGRRRTDNSMFGPVLIIAVGVYFLLKNLGMLPDVNLNWGLALRMWPLLLIFLGINLIVSYAPRPFGSFLSAVVGVVTVGIFGYVLLFGTDNPVFSRLGLATTQEVQHKLVEFDAEDVNTAVIDIRFGIADTTLYALEDSPNLLEADLTYYDQEPTVETKVDDGQAFVDIAMDEDGQDLWNPSNWAGFSDENQWQIGLNPRATTALNLDMGTGDAQLHLEDLTLSQFQINMGVGDADVWMPGGQYEANYRMGTGELALYLAEDSTQTIEIDGGVGDIVVYVPEGLALRVDLEQGIGDYSFDLAGLEQIRGDENDGVWETADFANANHRITLIIQTGVGDIRIQEQ